MESARDLIGKAAAALRNGDIKGRDFSRPHYPACVFYFGEHTARRHAKLYEDLMAGWGGGAENIVYCAVREAGELRFSDVATDRGVTVVEIQGSLTRLLSLHEVFCDMSRVAVYCLIDTAGVGSAEEFRQWYLAIEKIREFSGVALFSMLIVMLDEGIECAGKAALIKKKLCEIFKGKGAGPENSHLYDSVFVIGSRYKNGGISDEPWVCSKLPADIILLANSRSDDCSNRRLHLYGSGRPAITAAYGCVEKPVYEIALITIRTMLKRILESIERQSVDTDSLAAALQIRNGRSGICDKFYSAVKPQFPKEAEYIPLLPGKVTAGFSFEEADKASDGCLRAFLDLNHLRIVEDELENCRGQLESSIKEMLLQSFNAAQLRNGLPAQTVDAALARAEIGLVGNESGNVCQVVEVMARKRIAEVARGATKRAAGLAAEEARACYDSFRLVIDETDMQNTALEEGTRKNLLSTYEPKVRRAFSDPVKLERLAGRVLAVGNDKRKMLGILLETAEALFDSDDDYKLPYFDELTKRLGHLADTMKAQEYVGDELIKNLGDRICFYANSVFQERIFEAYLLNTGTAAPARDNLLVKHLEERPKPPETQRTFFNTCSSDMAESVWFYALSEDNLMT
ncbi:MAG: hypothetical protein FWG42_10960 [Clostridiales bacterium]|nr:hypothetical protein [Clostridiales bacterium]